MNVANILPGDEIKVELVYSELLVPERGVYEFVYPTVVGPRYSNADAASAPESEHWVQNPYLRPGDAPATTFDFRAAISGGMPLRQVTSPSHELKVEFPAPARALLTLPAADTTGDQSRPRHPLPARGQPHRNRPDALRNLERRTLLPVPGRTAAAFRASSRAAAGVHLHRGRVGVDARLPPRDHQGTVQDPPRTAAPRRLVQRAVLLRRRVGALAHVAAGHRGQQEPGD